MRQEDDGEEDLTDEEGEALEVGDVVMVKPDNTLGILKKLDEKLAQAHVAKHIKTCCFRFVGGRMEAYKSLRRCVQVVI